MTRRVVRVVSWLVVAGVTALVAVAVVVPRLAGATPYTVLTGSMAPTYPPGTLVVVRPVDIDDVRAGDVVTFQLRSGLPAVATHRVVRVGWTSDGEKLLTTQGDANATPDAVPVREVQLRGEVWYALPWVGRLNVLLSPGQHQLLVRLAAGGLFLYAGLLLVRGWRSRPRGEPTAGDAPDAPSRLPAAPADGGRPRHVRHRHRTGAAA
jgi:signal peptidase